MKHKLEFLECEFKSIDRTDGMMRIGGYAALFNSPDDADSRSADIIKKGAFAKTLKERGDRLKVLYNHDFSKVIGKVDKIYEDEKGLYVELLISASEEDLQTKIEEGIYNELSIGYITIQKDFQGDFRILKEVKLYEISIVTLGKHPMTRFIEMKSIDRVSYLETEFDKIIDSEENEEKKYNLMMLKGLAVELPQEAQHNTPSDKIDFSKFIFN